MDTPRTRTARGTGSRFPWILGAIALVTAGALVAFEGTKRRAETLPEVYYEVDLSVSGMH